VWPTRLQGLEPHIDPDQFRAQARDLYVPAGDTGFWQAALRKDDREVHPRLGAAATARREDDEDLRVRLADTIASRSLFTIDLLYSDSEGGQRTISRFSLSPRGEGMWAAAVTKHWNLDRPDPR
jgi:hypothetical protein